MNKNEFLEIIYKESSFLPNKQRRQVMDYFTELLKNCDNNTDILATFGYPADALRRHLNSTRMKSRIPKPLFIAAMTVLAPIIAKASIVVLIPVMAIFIIATVISVLLPISGICMWLGGVKIIFLSVTQQALFADKLWQIAIGLMCFAVGILILILVYKLYSKLIPWILRKLSSLYHRIEKRRHV